jgi:hypothetical protein
VVDQLKQAAAHHHCRHHHSDGGHSNSAGQASRSPSTGGVSGGSDGDNGGTQFAAARASSPPPLPCLPWWFTQDVDRTLAATCAQQQFDVSASTGYAQTDVAGGVTIGTAQYEASVGGVLDVPLEIQVDGTGAQGM